MYGWMYKCLKLDTVALKTERNALEPSPVNKKKKAELSVVS